ncbi:hypothetical protein AOQ84DRAFT_86401 [Glonium stellatum]|uniref:Uncharacterized protein n=1 Tax=Glonium stellatum TaxID=574774 RepID=A0A8E2JQL1_9PEZI|nr:hypothetical protein AOQ84DRAFT_86401 [Glonium stellatum]
MTLKPSQPESRASRARQSSTPDQQLPAATKQQRPVPPSTRPRVPSTTQHHPAPPTACSQSPAPSQSETMAKQRLTSSSSTLPGCCSRPARLED